MSRGDSGGAAEGAHPDTTLAMSTARAKDILRDAFQGIPVHLGPSVPEGGVIYTGRGKNPTLPHAWLSLQTGIY
ncbi:protein of unknown function [Kyrpidia spormannii]|uniref:Uncharacterized protein n=1 Tax=Kyrpidia spormannii TaxID=2055160 RepID=A0A6F9E8I9_9BACL|nr:protein of unknown function [Kyrpidia spormannii]